jgi:hypothetical protein
MHSKEDPRLFKFLDCIHYSLAILNTQYYDLSSILAKLTPSDSDQIVRALAVSWSIVDSIHRIREVAQNIPGLSGQTPQLKSFINDTSIVEDFRDYIQHLRNELAKINLDNFPVWGSFSWIEDKDNQEICHTALTGTVIRNIGFNSCVYDLKEKKWVSKAVLAIKGRVFNIDPCYESAKQFCEFAMDWIKKVKAGQINEKKGIPVISAQLVFPNTKLNK